MFRKILLLCGLFVANLTIAQSYQALDDDSIFIAGENGQRNLSLQALDEAVSDLWRHARSYPLKFDSEAEKAQAKEDIFRLAHVIYSIRNEIVGNEDKALNRHLQFLEARTAVMAYNFDEPKALPVADKLYESLLKEKESAALYEEYGVFLASSVRPEKARRMLEKALAGGEKSALYSLGLLSIEADQEKAKAYFTEYTQYFPQDESAAKILEALNDDNLKINRCTYDKNGECQLSE